MINNMTSANMREILLSACATSGGLAIGTTKTKVKTVNAINYTINGINYVKAGTDDLFVHTTTTVQPVLTTCYYLLCLDTSGNASIVKGTAKLTATLATDPAVLPAAPAGKCVVGALKIVCANAATFTPATTNHDATDVTTTYFNLQRYPINGIPGTAP